jgi:hypothetical protein
LVSIREFFEVLYKKKILGYSWVATNILVILYMIIYVLLGPAESLPTPGQWLDPHGISFLLLITFSFFLLFLFIISFFRDFYSKFSEKITVIKLVGINLLCFLLALLIPIFIFIAFYIIAFFLWYIINSIIFVLFLRELTINITKKFIVNEKTSLLSYLSVWFLSFILFGYIFITFPWMSLNLSQQMPLLLFPLFIILLPVLGFILKRKSNSRPQIPLFSLLILGYVLYIWFRYLNYSTQVEILTISDASFDIILITYIYYSLFKHATKITERLNNRISYELLLFLFIWARISSMILLLTVSEYQILGITASEGTYLITMFLIIIFGFLQGIIWLRKKEKSY